MSLISLSCLLLSVARPVSLFSTMMTIIKTILTLTYFIYSNGSVELNNTVFPLGNMNLKTFLYIGVILLL